MTTLSPSGGGRHRSAALPVVAAVVIALVIGVLGGWWFAGRDQGKPQAGPTTSSTCTRTGTATATGTSTKKPTGKPSATPSRVALPLPSTITLNVYNATTRKGLARSTSVELGARGFRISKVANDPSKKIIAASAEIRYGPAGAVNAKVVAAQVIGAVLVPDHRKDASVDFVVGDGYVALSTPQEAAAALSAVPSPTATASPC
jgi:hypothetical protein